MVEDVTVTIPVYNEVKYIRDAVESVVDQVKEVIICDNCSEDGTVEILKELEYKHHNINLILQNKNYGVVQSFRVLYENVKTEFVMHMGAHDLVADNYVKTLMKDIQKDDVVMACAVVEHIDENGKIFDHDGLENFIEGLGSDNVFQRVQTIIERLRDCSIFYGIMYTDLFRKYIVYSSESHGDHVFLAKMALEGKYKISNDTKFYRRYLNRNDSEAKYMKRLQGNVTENRLEADLTYMIRSQIEIVDSIEGSDQEKEYYSKLARKTLKERLSGKGGRVDYRPVIEQFPLQT